MEEKQLRLLGVLTVQVGVPVAGGAPVILPNWEGVMDRDLLTLAIERARQDLIPSMIARMEKTAQGDAVQPANETMVNGLVNRIHGFRK